MVLFALIIKGSFRKRNILKRKPYLYSLPIIFAFLLAISFFLLARAVQAEFYFTKSLSTRIAKEIYSYQKKAVLINPYNSAYRRAFSQTNLLIAGGIVRQSDDQQNTLTPGVEERGGFAPRSSENEAGKTSGVELSDTDRQTIIQAIRASIDEAKAAVKLDDHDSKNWENLALVYRNLINLVEDADLWAISSYQRAIILDPNNPELRLGLGGVYYSISEYKEAIKAFEEAIKLKPGWPNAYYNLAWNHYKIGNQSQAISGMEKVITLLKSQNKGSELKQAEKDLSEFKSSP